MQNARARARASPVHGRANNFLNNHNSCFYDRNGAEQAEQRGKLLHKSLAKGPRAIRFAAAAAAERIDKVCVYPNNLFALPGIYLLF